MSDPNQPADGDPFAPPPEGGSANIPGIPGDAPPPPPPPPPPAYGAPAVPAYGAPQPAYAAAAPQNGPGTTALVMGILGLACCGILAIVAIIQGRKGMALADQGLATNRGIAQAGMILGWVGIALWIVGVLFYAIVFVFAAANGSTTVGG